MTDSTSDTAVRKQEKTGKWVNVIAVLEIDPDDWGRWERSVRSNNAGDPT